MLFGIASSRRSRRYAPKCACAAEFAHICATKLSETKSLSTNIGTIPKNIPTNFELKRLKPKLDIVKKLENRVHEVELTDSNVSLQVRAVVRVVRPLDRTNYSI